MTASRISYAGTMRRWWRTRDGGWVIGRPRRTWPRRRSWWRGGGWPRYRLNRRHRPGRHTPVIRRGPDADRRPGPDAVSRGDVPTPFWSAPTAGLTRPSGARDRSSGDEQPKAKLGGVQIDKIAVAFRPPAGGEVVPEAAHRPLL